MSETPLPLLVSLAILTAILLLWQGIHILRTGRIAPFFMSNGSPLTLDNLPRGTYGSFYIAAAASVTSLLIFAADQDGFRRLLRWIEANGGMLFWLFLFGVVGLLYLAVPADMLRWSLSGRGIEPPYDPRLLRLARLMGSAFLIIVLAFMARV